MRALVTYTIGGGWGSDEPAEGTQAVRVVRGADFLEVELADPDGLPLRFESDRKVETRLLREGDIVLEISGGTKDRPTGRAVYISEALLERASEPLIPASFCRLVRSDVRKVVPRFLYYWLRDMHTAGRTWAYQNRSTGISNFQFEYFLDMERVRLPQLGEQQAIVDVLCALDDKIESNRRVIRLCDELWQLRAATYVAPVDSCADEALSSLASFVNGRAFTKAATGTGRMVVRIAELNSGPGGSTVYNDIDVSDEHLARPGDLLFSWSGSLTVHRWFRPEAIVNQHIFKVIPRPGIPLWLVHGYLQRTLPWFRGIAADKATTMGHIQRHHLDVKVRVPSVKQLADLNATCGLLWNRALQAEREILTLTELRDALLPRLISGELRIRDGETLVESVL